jgi:hypothetical protein
MADTRENFVRFSLRLPKPLMERLESATESKRSVNAEIIARLEASFDSSREEMLKQTIDRQSEQLLRYQSHYSPAKQKEIEETPRPLNHREQALVDELMRRLEARDAKRGV